MRTNTTRDAHRRRPRHEHPIVSTLDLSISGDNTPDVSIPGVSISDVSIPRVSTPDTGNLT